MQPTDPSTLPARLDELWARDAPSVASRVALAARALCELPEAHHAAWGERLARCFEELAGSSSPLLPDAAARSAGPSSSGSSLSHGMCWELYSTASAHASLDCCMAALRALPAPRQGHMGSSPAAIAQALASKAIERLALARRHSEISEILGLGFEPARSDFESLLAQGAAVLDHAESARLIRAAFHADFERDAFGGARTLPAKFYPKSFFTCPHPEWHSILLDKFRAGDPLPDLANLGIVHSEARRVSLLTPEAVAAAKAQWDARSSGSRRQRTWPDFSAAERSAAAVLAQEAREARMARLRSIARASPALAAQCVMDQIAPAAAAAAWKEAGLDTVDASGFLFGPYAPPVQGGVARPDRPRRAWPVLGREPFDAAAVLGIKLSFLDCMALSGATREALEAEAARGARPTAGLAQALALPAVARQFGEADSLWLASFSGNPAPSTARRLLKA